MWEPALLLGLLPGACLAVPHAFCNSSGSSSSTALAVGNVGCLLLAGKRRRPAADMLRSHAAWWLRSEVRMVEIEAQHPHCVVIVKNLHQAHIARLSGAAS